MIRCNQKLEPDLRAIDPEPMTCLEPATHYLCGSRELPICPDCIDSLLLTDDAEEFESGLVPIPAQDYLIH